MEWYPTPSYLAKRRVILEFVAGLDVSRFLEVGCGAGDLLSVLEKKGLSGVGIDLSASARAAARTRVSGGAVAVSDAELAGLDGGFDLVIASEVMEHCEDDIAFLELLGGKLHDGGHLLLTVPSHMDKWGANDDFCGHVRRYERAELNEKLVRAGFEPLAIYCYGFPICNIMKPLYDRAISKELDQEKSAEERTQNSSGMWLFPAVKRLFYLLFNDLTMAPFYMLQRPFYGTELGNGFFVAARKAPSLEDRK
ncbi:class I SAM-dependent methyltransferase [Geomonas sp. Red875]|uniref:Class I SAM-dependent methyltransferase n=2 Tax=Geomesophilobacter sediminis TaxID=2798584 RepID=A0A8J7JI17_9BACT|nr:class I SAM-dependent methyltransferase [Geomesophilobacter sediminis]